MVVGAMGPWKLGEPENQHWLRNNLRSWLARWDVSLGYTDLEPGAATMFAEVLSEAAIPYRVVLPKRSGAETQNSPLFETLCKQAAAVHILGESPTDGWHEARLHILDNCDVILMVLSGDSALDEYLRTLQDSACQAKTAVVSFLLNKKVAFIVCKDDQF